VAFSPGARLGPYEILGSLGAGGMGEVYRRATRGWTATPAEGLSRDPQQRLRFDHEARAISALDAHPHICALHDVGGHEGHAFLVMQLVEGVTLADRLATGALPITDALTIAVQLADAMTCRTARKTSSTPSTSALVRTRPVPSINLPNLITFVAAAACDAAARKNRSVSRVVTRMVPQRVWTVAAKVVRRQKQVKIRHQLHRSLFPPVPGSGTLRSIRG
jgi:Protein tyrosine and serine/threonine kinase